MEYIFDIFRVVWIGHLQFYSSELLQLPLRWWCDQLIGTKLVLAHNSCHIKIGDFWWYFFDHHGWTKWVTENPQPCEERGYSQLSSNGCGFSLAHLVCPWHSKQNCQKLQILIFLKFHIKIGDFWWFCFDRHGRTKCATEYSQQPEESWKFLLYSRGCEFSVDIWFVCGDQNKITKNHQFRFF